MTARELINRSLKLIGVLAEGETPTAEMQADAVSTLNDLIESWGIDGLMVFERARQSFTLPGAQSFYTIGIGGDFNTDRPNLISEAGIEMLTSNPSIELPLEIINEEEFQLILTKSIVSTIPTKLYYVMSNPLAKIYLWPRPSIANNLILYTPKQIASISSVSATITLPPGYSRALRFNLAVDLAVEYGRQIDPMIMQTAMESKADIKRQNTQVVYMTPDTVGMDRKRAFNWLTGE